MKEKMYFEVDRWESCFPLQHFLDEIDRDQNLVFKLQIAKRIKSDGTFYCITEGECFDNDGTICGERNCQFYEPRNGKNGICKSHRNCYEPVGEELTLTKRGLCPTKKVL